MNLHEYQAKELLQKYGMPIPPFWVADSVESLRKITQQNSLSQAVVKVQIHAGGRKKAGGVKFCKTKEEIEGFGKSLFGMKIVNNQTGPSGVICHQVIVTLPVEIKKEYYLGAIIDRKEKRPLLIASPEGGVEIEEVAERTPEKILKLPISLEGTLHPYQLLRLAKFMHWEKEVALQGKRAAEALVKAFMQLDGSLLEINPFVLSDSDQLWALDAKLSIDDNALFRHQELAEAFDTTQLMAQEVVARAHELSYIALDGNIGCMVNGAGLAMATMDLIQLAGGKPANFLDVGGSASKEKVAAGFSIILADPKVKVVLVNIFGGIMNCATIAEGIIEACKEMAIGLPLIVRLEGTNVGEGKRLLEESKLPIVSAEDLHDAAEKAVAALCQS